MTASLRAFLRSEAAGGIVLLAAALLALMIANSPWASTYEQWKHATNGLVIAPALGPMTTELWINDGLMAVFFLLVGLEIKRELVGGELSRPADRRLPVIAAAAGMIVPALLYLTLTSGDPALARGWAIPAATDIAFAIGVMALLGKRVPAALKLFLTTVAIVDDMGAVAIIALAYNHGLDMMALVGAGVVLAVMMLLNRRGVRALSPYLLLAILLWWLVLRSGVHATVAGVLTAMIIPVASDAASPLHRLEHALNPWVAFAIVPLFGFANAGVALTGAALSPLVVAVAGGLFVGKQVGVFGAVVLAERLGIAPRPAGTSLAQVYGAALLAGIGFTMSLFIGGLAFPDQSGLIADIKIGVLAGSVLSALAGYAVLRFAGRRQGEPT